MIIQVHHWYNNTVRDLFAALDTILLKFLSFLIKLIFRVAFFDLSSFEELRGLYTKIYVVLTIFMIFKLTFTFINYVINPEALNDQKQGVSKIIRNSIIMILLLIILPGIFSGDILGSKEGNAITRVQKAIVPILSKVLIEGNDYADSSIHVSDGIINYGNDTSQEDDENYLPNRIALAIAKIFYHPAEETYNHVCTNKKNNINNEAPPIKTLDDISKTVKLTCRKTNEDDIGKKYNDFNFYRYSYLYFISTIVIGFIDYILIRMTVIVGKRAFKLIVLQIIFPIPVILLIDPKAMEAADSPFNTWLHNFVQTFLEIFFQLGVLFLFLTLIGMLIAEFNTNSQNYKGFGGLLLQLALIISLITFAGEAPSFVKKALGIKDDKDPDDELGKIIGTTVGNVSKAATGAAVGAAKKIGNKGAELASNIAGGVIGGISAGGLRGVFPGIGSGIADTIGYDTNRSLGGNITHGIGNSLSRTTAGRAYNAEVDRINAGLTSQAINDAINGNINNLSRINGTNTAEVEASISSGKESVRNYAEGQAAKAQEEYNQANEKYTEALKKAEKAEKDGNKNEAQKWKKEAEYYEAAMNRAQHKVNTNTAVADALKSKQDHLSENVSLNHEISDLSSINGDGGPIPGQSEEDYANNRAAAAQARIDRAEEDLTDATGKYNEALGRGDLDKAALYAGEMKKQQSIIDENTQIRDANREMVNYLTTDFKESLRKGDLDAMARFNGDSEETLSEKINSGELTRQSYAASKAAEAQVEVDFYEQKMNDAQAREAYARSFGASDTSAAVVKAREDYAAAKADRDEAQHIVDVNSEIANNLEHNQRDLATNASKGDLDSLIKLNATVGGSESPSLDSLSTTESVVDYTNDQITTYDALASSAETAYREAVSKVATATSPADQRRYSREAEQHKIEFEEYSRLRDANAVAQLSAISNDSSYSGDFDEFAKLNLEIASPEALSDPDLLEVARSEFTSDSGVAAEYSVRCKQAAADYRDQISTIDRDIETLTATGRIEEAAQLHIERTKLESKLQTAERMAEVDRDLVASREANDRELANRTRSGDFDAFMDLTGADTSTRDALRGSVDDQRTYAHSALAECRSREADYATREADTRAILDGDRSSLSETEIRNAEATLEKINTERKQNELRLRAIQSYESRLPS